MKVRELIELLQKCDPDLPIATHAHNHTYMSGIDEFSHGPLRVILLHTYGGDHVCLGDVSKMQINKPNWYGKKVLDDLPREIPQNWGEYP
jgi:hypothetical protein